MNRIEVDSPTAPYSIHIETGLASRAGAIVSEVAPHACAMVVIDRNVQPTIGQVLTQSLQEAGYVVTEAVIDADERAKTLATVEAIYERMLEANLERKSPVIAVGGGLTGDVAGFAAATYLRGVPVVHVPTTLLAMVDASIGGKTGVNFNLPGGGLGKNLIGAFWQPRAVLIDPIALRTLDDRDLRAGIGECIKHAIIADAALFERLEAQRDAILARDSKVLQDLIARSAHVKVRLVTQDERESGARALLNLGHTFGHVIETRTELDLRHGEAVAIGLCAAAACAVSLELLSDADARRIVSLVSSCGLPARMATPIGCAQLLADMQYDKKVIDSALRLVLPSAIGRAVIRADVPEATVADAWRSVGAI